MRTAAVLLTLAALAACEVPRRPAAGTTTPPAAEPSAAPDEAPDYFAGMDFMGTAASRAERAPYSPVGWPLQREDVVSFDRWHELVTEFEGWQGVSAPFWIGKTVFGARWLLDDAVVGPPPLYEPGSRYIGHFPTKTYWRSFGRNLPDHLHEMSQTEEGFEEIARRLFDPKALAKEFSELEELQRIWTREAWLDGYTGAESGQ